MATPFQLRLSRLRSFNKIFVEQLLRQLFSNCGSKLQPCSDSNIGSVSAAAALRQQQLFGFSNNDSDISRGAENFSA